MSEGLKPAFGDIIENGWASAGNPTRTGFFVREGCRSGRMNAGRYFEVTDGNGKFWELPLGSDYKITVTRPDQPLAAGMVAVERKVLEVILHESLGLMVGPKGREISILSALTSPTLDAVRDALAAVPQHKQEGSE